MAKSSYITLPAKICEAMDIEKGAEIKITVAGKISIAEGSEVKPLVASCFKIKLAEQQCSSGGPIYSGVLYSIVSRLWDFLVVDDYKLFIFLITSPNDNNLPL